MVLQELLLYSSQKKCFYIMNILNVKNILKILLNINSIFIKYRFLNTFEGIM